MRVLGIITTLLLLIPACGEDSPDPAADPGARGGHGGSGNDDGGRANAGAAAENGGDGHGASGGSAGRAGGDETVAGGAGGDSSKAGSSGAGGDPASAGSGGAGGDGSSAGGSGGEGGSGGDGDPGSPFVSVDPEQPRFLLNGEPFYFLGTGNYTVQYLQAKGAVCAADSACGASQLDAMQAAGLTVARINGHWDCSVYDVCIQTSPGVYQQSAIEALDWAIAEAGKRGMRVVVTLGSQWTDYGGISKYIEWYNAENEPDVFGDSAFYTEPGIRGLFKDYVQDLLERVNVYTGVAYKDDPTIMSWELLDQARCATGEPCSAQVIATWAQEMAAFVKSLDPNHMVALGDEGLGTPSDDFTLFRAQLASSWITEFGYGDVERYLSIPDIDYATTAWYPGNWTASPDLFEPWLLDHVAMATAAGKPLVASAFALATDVTTRDAVYADWLDALEQSSAAGGFVWATNALPYPDYDGFSIQWDPNGVDSHTTTLALLNATSAAMSAK